MVISNIKINKRAATGLLLLAMLGVGGINCVLIEDAKVNHREEVCEICSMLQANIYIEDELGTVGIVHQIEAIKKEYEEKGIKVNVKYYDDYHLHDSNLQYTKLSEIDVEKVGTHFFAKPGYKLLELEGKHYVCPVDYLPVKIGNDWYGGKRVNSNYQEETFKAIEVTDENGNIINVINLSGKNIKRG